MQKKLSAIFRPLYRRIVSTVVFLTAPRSDDKDLARRERILNILLLGAISLTLIAVFDAVISELTGAAEPGAGQEIIIIFSILLGCFFASRAGKSLLISYSIITILLTLTLFGAYRWGVDFPQGLLTLSLLVVMSGILISSRFSFIVVLISGVSLILLSYFQIYALHLPSSYWKQEELTMGDSIVAIMTLGIISLVSWLFNQEMEKALKRARASELVIKRQKDELEIIVEQRTKQLKQAQAEKLAQVYRFAELGKSASGMFHDLVNPLTLTSLNLNNLNKHISKPELAEARVALDRAILGTKRLERFISAARKQVQDQEILDYFSIQDEIHHSILVLEPKASKNRVQINFEMDQDVKTFGNAIKFNQLITNLLSNAVDSYQTLKGKKRPIEINTSLDKNTLKIAIQDHGCGIRRDSLPKIFDPLFSTKKPTGTGIGLSICKEITEKDFKGQLSVISTEGVGSTFIVEFPIKKPARS